MIAWTLDRVAEVTGGRLVGEDVVCTGVGVDSRDATPGSLYVAVRGERFDGHDFVRGAMGSGAAGALVERETGDGPAVVVADTRRALGSLAAAYRETLAATVIGVTGSCGKTTTCRLIDAALASTLRGTASAKSFNNEIGVPLTLLRARGDDAYVVCEMGTSSPGEIAALSAIVRPDVAVVVCVGRSHLEKLGDVDGVRREKASIVSGLHDGGLVLVPAGDAALRALVGAGAETVEPADVSVGASGTRFSFGGEAYRIPLVGAHHAGNGAFAVRVALEMGVAPSVIRRGMGGVRASAMRFETHEVGGAVIVNDAYNANPESMAASLRAFASAHAGAARRIAVLGDMLELGAHADAAHREIADLACGLGLDAVVAVGPHTCRAMGERAPLTFGSLDGVAEKIAGVIRPGDAVLLKGSRGMGLERVLDSYRERCAEGAGA